MADNKTKPTPVRVSDFLDGIADEGRRADARALCAMMERLSGEPPTMWGPSIVGFGRVHYRYESGREGDMPRISFSPRATSLVLYLSDEFDEHGALLARLGKHKTGVSCLYVKRLADVDRAVLEALVEGSLAATARNYPG